ncbi:hypothetical protein MJO52_03165 [Microbulbifer variabilis]|uniref:Phage protein n=1 Tax=Microbulbifer variabilis TaxID=266805 RepID=A0ABY4VCW8_9GAMM|nr:hypothetical protein [Microbulbifer variabilis]USD22150.1 hypothetical protein MJO52_03165 [Microbulbifer variabilis]
MTVKITRKGNGLNDLLKKVKENSGQHQVSFSEMFNPQFISANSEFSDIDSLFQAGGFKVESKEDFEAIPDQEWEEFIVANTSFKSWVDMHQAAESAYMKKKLGL